MGTPLLLKQTPHLVGGGVRQSNKALVPPSERGRWGRRACGRCRSCNHWAERSEAPSHRQPRPPLPERDDPGACRPRGHTPCRAGRGPLHGLGTTPKSIPDPSPTRRLAVPPFQGGADFPVDLGPFQIPWIPLDPASRFGLPNPPPTALLYCSRITESSTGTPARRLSPASQSTLGGHLLFDPSASAQLIHHPKSSTPAATGLRNRAASSSPPTPCRHEFPVSKRRHNPSTSSRKVIFHPNLAQPPREQPLSFANGILSGRAVPFFRASGFLALR